MQNRPQIRARVYPLDHSSTDDLSSCTSPVERLELVETLTREAWALSKRELPTYEGRRFPWWSHAKKEKVNPDGEDFLRALLNADARFMVVGAMVTGAFSRY